MNRYLMLKMWLLALLIAVPVSAQGGSIRRWRVF